MEARASQVLHATCVALGNRGVLITGPSGSGKSALALELIGLGAALVADDQVCTTRQGDSVIATAPPGLPPLIEARGVGLLRAPLAPCATVALVVDLARTETVRLPPLRTTRLCDLPLPLLHKVESGYFPAAIRLYLLSGHEE